MGDRTFIIVVIAIVAMAFYSYQKALHERGGVTPLQELLAKGGLTSTDKDDSYWSKKVETIDLQQHVSELQNKLKMADARKNDFLKTRTENTTALMELNRQFYEEIIKLIPVIQGEFDRLKAQNELMDPYQEQIIQLAQQPDVTLRGQQLTAQHEQILNLAKTIIMRPDQELSIINKILLETHDILTSPFEASRWGCTDMSVCLKESVQAIDNQIAFYMDQNLIQPLGQLADLTELALILEHEYKFFLNNTQGTNDKLKENNQQFEEELDALVENLTEADADDMAKLVKIFDRIEKEQDVALGNLNAHHQHLAERFSQAQQITNGVFERLKSTRVVDFTTLIEEYKQQEPQRKKAYQAIIQESQPLLTAMAQWLYESEATLKVVAAHKNIDLEGLKEEMGLVPAEELPKRAWKVSDQQRVSELERKLHADTEEQMKKMQEKAVENEATIEQMLQLYGQ
ncbi:MAG TPA: hypothetical protein VI749_00155 [Candidatus Omnitrophota bacterium]|nr:hypothetical protein [Candidatus Omnitrophota bacterium]